MGGKKISELMDIWAAYQQFSDSQSPPFASAQELYDKIDSTKIGDVPWQVSRHNHCGKINGTNKCLASS